MVFRSPVCYILLIAFFLCSETVFADSHTVAVHYVIHSLGSDIGTVSAKTVGTAADNDFRADTTVHVRLLLYDFSLTSSETASIRGGKLVKYHKTTDTKGHRKEISGERNGAVFTITVRDGGTLTHKDFPVTGYVTTNMEYTEMTLVSGEIRRWRVLDLENAEIVDREYRYVAEEQTIINGHSSGVVSSKFVDENSEGKRWTAVVSGLPVVMRQEGKEKTGLFNPSYTVRQVRITVAP